MVSFSTMPSRPLIGAALAVLLGLGAGPAAAAPPPASGAAPTISAGPGATAGLLDLSQRLQDFMASPAPITLRTDRDEYEVPVAIAPVLDPVSAVLHLEFTNSSALLEGRSQLVVRLNGAVVAQFPLQAGRPLVSADITLPIEFLRLGANALTFAVAQHYTNDCENPGAAELWTQIDTARSSMTLKARPMAREPRLSDLQDILTPALGGHRRFTFMAGHQTAQHLSPALLATGATIAEAVGLRLGYVSPDITFAPPSPEGMSEAGRDLVLFGTRDDIAPMLPPGAAGRITSGFIGVFPKDNDPGRVMLVVSGTDQTELDRAAEALTVANFPFVDAPGQAVTQLQRGVGDVFFPRNAVREDRRYSFAELGFPTRSFHGARPTNASLDLVMQADLSAPDTAHVELDLDLSYGARLRQDSVMNVIVNGHFQQAIPLDNAQGATFRGYKVSIPLRQFVAGHNMLTFEVVMVPFAGGACVPQQTNNLVLTLQGSSMLTMPAANHLVAQPDLGLFAASGFPYTAEPGGGQIGLVVASHDASTIAAGWMMMGRLSQLADAAFPKAEVGFDFTESHRHLLVAGAVPDLDGALLAAAPLTPQGVASLAYASGEPGLAASAEAMSLPDRIGHALGIVTDAKADPARPSALRGVSHIDGRADLGGNRLLIAYRSPWDANRTVTVLTASARDQLASAAQGLVSPVVWYQLGGDVALWHDASDRVFTERVGRPFHLGDRNSFYAARYYIAAYPVAWIGACLTATVALALLARLAIVRRRRRLYPGSEEATP